MLFWMQTQVPNPPKEKEGHKGSRNGPLRKRKICYHQIFLVFHWVESRVSRKIFLFHTFVSCGVPCFFYSGTKPKIGKMNMSIYIFPNVDYSKHFNIQNDYITYYVSHYEIAGFYLFVLYYFGNGFKKIAHKEH